MFEGGKRLYMSRLGCVEAEGCEAGGGVDCGGTRVCGKKYQI